MGGTANPTILLNSLNPTPPAGKTNVVFVAGTESAGVLPVTAYYESSSGGGAEFEADGDSITGFTQDYLPYGSPIAGGQASSGYLPFDFASAYELNLDSDMYQDLAFSVAGAIIEFDIASAPSGTPGQATVAFGCAHPAAGPAFILGVGGNKSGIGYVTTSFQNGYTAPAIGPTSLVAGTWYHVKLVINEPGTFVTWYVNGVVQGQVALTGSTALQGDYLALSGNGYGGGGYLANLRIYQS